MSGIPLLLDFGLCVVPVRSLMTWPLLACSPIFLSDLRVMVCILSASHAMFLLPWPPNLSPSEQNPPAVSHLHLIPTPWGYNHLYTIRTSWVYRCAVAQTSALSVPWWFADMTWAIFIILYHMHSWSSTCTSKRKQNLIIQASCGLFWTSLPSPLTLQGKAKSVCPQHQPECVTAHIEHFSHFSYSLV